MVKKIPSLDHSKYYPSPLITSNKDSIKKNTTNSKIRHNSYSKYSSPEYSVPKPIISLLSSESIKQQKFNALVKCFNSLFLFFRAICQKIFQILKRLILISFNLVLKSFGYIYVHSYSQKINQLKDKLQLSSNTMI
jgi:hypothetical protein